MTFEVTATRFEQVRELFSEATFIDHKSWCESEIKGLAYDIENLQAFDPRIPIFAKGTAKGKNVVVMLMPGNFTTEKVIAFAQSCGVVVKISDQVRREDLVVSREPYILIRQKTMHLHFRESEEVQDDGMQALALVALVVATKKVSGNILFNNSTILCQESVHVAGRKWLSSIEVEIRENKISIEPSKLYASSKDFIALALRC